MTPDQIWMINFTKLVSRINATAFGAKPPSYQVVLYLDRAVRTYPVPSHLWEVTKTGGVSLEVMKAWGLLEAKDLSEFHFKWRLCSCLNGSFPSPSEFA